MRSQTKYRNYVAAKKLFLEKAERQEYTPLQIENGLKELARKCGV